MLRFFCAPWGRPTRWAALVVALLGMIAAARPAGAAVGAKQAWTPRVETRVGPTGAFPAPGELVVNGIVVLRLRTQQAGLLPEERVVIAAERLRAAIALGLKAGDVTVDAISDKANPRLEAAGQIIATSGLSEAKGTGASPAGLALGWARAIRRALAVPGLSVSATQLLVPLNETRVVKLGGAARGEIGVVAASGGASKLVEVRANGEGELTLSGSAPGRETLALSREGVSVTVSVVVQPYAGRIDPPRMLVVTGTSVPSDLILRHAVAAAYASARPNPGARVQVSGAPITSSAGAPLFPGQVRTIEVPVSLSGPDMIPIARAVRVFVSNQPLAPVPTSALLYSNSPERVERFQTLFVGRLPKAAGVASRLLYHHQSALSSAAWFTVELINDGDAPATVQVIGGDAGPVRDTVWVGYRAASDFVRDYGGDVGAFVDVPARARVALTATRWAPGLTISGLRELRVISGPAPLVRVAADIPGAAQTMPAPLIAFPLAGSGPGAAVGQATAAAALTLSQDVYAAPRKEIQARYVVGDRWTFLSIGRVPIRGVADGERKLEGNYGVFYDITLTLENPAQNEATVRLVFEPSAGLAGAIFVIDGKTVEIPQTNLPNEPVLAAYTLAPGATRTVRVRTLPLSGSNYPARLVVRP